MLKKNDSIALEAFLNVFLRLNQPFDEGAEQTLIKVIEDLKNLAENLDEGTEQTLIKVIENLKNLAENSPILNEQYGKERIEILRNYPSQTRKFIDPHSQSVALHTLQQNPSTESTQPAQGKRMFRKQGVLVIEAGASSEMDISTFISEMREERIQSQLKEIGL
jgi:hypothetical protein